MSHVDISLGSAKPTLGSVLLAEDDLVSQTVVVAMLAGSGYRVETVRDGMAAVEAASRQRYDAILMDCQMTAGAHPEDRARCIAADTDDYIASEQRRLAGVAGQRHHKMRPARRAWATAAARSPTPSFS